MRTLTENDNYNDESERTVGVAQTVTGTMVSIVPRRVNTQQTVQLTLTGMDTGASRTVNIVIDPPSGTGTLDFTKISPQTNNTNLNEVYVFTLADDSFAFLHVGDYQLHLDSSMPARVPVIFNSEFEVGGRVRNLQDPFQGFSWGNFISLHLDDRTITPFSGTDGSQRKMLSAVQGSNLYRFTIKDEFLAQFTGAAPFLKLVGIMTEGPIRIITSSTITRRLLQINPDEPLRLRVNGPGMVSIRIEITPRNGETPDELVDESAIDDSRQQRRQQRQQEQQTNGRNGDDNGTGRGGNGTGRDGNGTGRDSNGTGDNGESGIWDDDDSGIPNR
jgi:hypothetical protein